LSGAAACLAHDTRPRPAPRLRPTPDALVDHLGRTAGIVTAGPAGRSVRRAGMIRRPDVVHWPHPVQHRGLKRSPARPVTLARGLWRRLGPGGQLALWVLLTLRIGLGLIVVLSIHGAPAPGAPRGGEPSSLFLSAWQRWDADWYRRLAEEGYRAGEGTAAFYPLYPLLTRAVSLPLGGHILWAQLVVSSLAFFVAMWLLYRVARLDVGPLAARLAVLLTACFPTGFFLLAPYTESLFLALTLAAFWLAQAGRPWAAGLAGFGAALTRFQGVFLLAPLAFEYLRQRREQGKRPGVALLAATLPALGLVALSAYQRILVGESRSALEVQARWGYRIVPFWDVLAASWAHTAGNRDVIEALNLLCVLGFSLLALVAARRLPVAYALYIGPSLVLLLSRQVMISPLGGVSRFTLVLFPCFIVLALWLRRCPWLAGGWLVLSAMLETLLLIHWVHRGWVA
jgi:hypothetical protein